jgi:hypothetical protein
MVYPLSIPYFGDRRPQTADRQFSHGGQWSAVGGQK